MLDQLDRARRRERSERLAILADRRQRRMRERGRLEIVEADDGDVACRTETGVPDRLQRREGHQIRRGDDRGRRSGEREQRARLARSRTRTRSRRSGRTRPASSRPKRSASRRNASSRAGSRHGVRAAGDVRDPPVTERVEVGDREPHSFVVVRADERDALAAAPDVHADERKSARGEIGDERVVVVDADHDRRVEPVADADVERRHVALPVDRLRAAAARSRTARAAARSPRAPSRRRSATGRGGPSCRRRRPRRDASAATPAPGPRDRPCSRATPRPRARGRASARSRRSCRSARARRSRSTRPRGARRRGSSAGRSRAHDRPVAHR